MKLQCVLLIFCFVSVFADTQEDWKYSKTKKGITVYTRKVDGSNIKQFRAIASFNTNLSAICSVILDVDNQKSWMADTKESKLVKRNSQSEWISYVQLAIPWPYENRDMVMDCNIKQNPNNKEVKVRMSASLEYVKENRGVVRMKVAKGVFTLTPKPDGVDVEYVFLGDPAGKIPSWLINMMIVDGPIKSLSNLKVLVETDEMKKKEITFINN